MEVIKLTKQDKKYYDMDMRYKIEFNDVSHIYFTEKDFKELIQKIDNNNNRRHDSTAWCPNCGDSLIVSKECNNYGESYYCSGCDKEYKILEFKSDKK